MVALMLEQGGHQVTVAGNGREGEKRLAQGVFDLVITDVLMPERDGLEFLSAVRRSHPGMRVIAMTGGGHLSAGKYLKIARGLGARSLLEKPFRQEQLLAAVASALADDPRPPAP